MSTMKEKHTFVICAYKESAYLEECVKSLKEQKKRIKYYNGDINSE